MSTNRFLDALAAKERSKNDHQRKVAVAAKQEMAVWMQTVQHVVDAISGSLPGHQKDALDQFSTEELIEFQDGVKVFAMIALGALVVLEGRDSEEVKAVVEKLRAKSLALFEAADPAQFVQWTPEATQ